MCIFILSGFACFKSFFENVNIYEHKLKKPGMVSLENGMTCF